MKSRLRRLQFTKEAKGKGRAWDCETPPNAENKNNTRCGMEGWGETVNTFKPPVLRRANMNKRLRSNERLFMYSGMKWGGVVTAAGERRRMDGSDRLVFILHAPAAGLLLALHRAINHQLSSLYLQLITSKMTNK